MALEEWQWAWLAGIFEGEGSIAFTNDRSAQVRICMTDRDVIETVDSMAPSPRGIRTHTKPDRKTQFLWQLSGRDDVRAFLKGVLRYLHARRTEKAQEALRRLEANLGAAANRTHCKHGHEFTPENTYIRPNGTRRCYECLREYDRARKRRRPKPSNHYGHWLADPVESVVL